MKTYYFSLVIGCMIIYGLLFGGCTAKTEQQTSVTGESEMTNSTEPSPKLETATLGNVPNLHKHGNAYLAGQPSETDLEQAKDAGIKTVINLRMPEEMSFDEGKAVTNHGMTYHSAAIGSPDMMTDALFDELRHMLNQSDEKPVLLHCGSANRVGAIWLAHRVLDGGLSYEAALAEAKTVGLRNAQMEQKAKEYIERNRTTIEKEAAEKSKTNENSKRP